MNNIIPKVSIIVPAYKAEKYIHRCLDSIHHQTFTDWECILVDDGSPDTSGDICDEYAAKDSRFKVIHRENGGVAMARQTGVDAAIGEYLIHADPDDYVELNMLEEMVTEIERQGVDILLTDFFKDKLNGSIVIDKQTFNGTTCKDMTDDILFQRLHGSLWNKIVKRSCYRAASPQFFSGINYCEDVLIWVQMSRFNVSVGYLPKAYYHYVSTEGSITARVTKSGYAMRKMYIKKLMQFGVSKKFVDIISLRVKLFAMRDGIMTRKEYYDFMPPTLESINSLNWFPYKLFATLAFFRMYYSGLFCFKLLHKIALIKRKVS